MFIRLSTFSTFDIFELQLIFQDTTYHRYGDASPIAWSRNQGVETQVALSTDTLREPLTK